MRSEEIMAFFGCEEVVALAGSSVECAGNGVTISLGDVSEAFSLREVLLDRAGTGAGTTA